MTRVQIRRGTSAQWASSNPILAAGEPGLDTTTGMMKVGDGTSYWNNLLNEWAPASLVAQVNALPRGVTAAAIGSAYDGVTLVAGLTWLTAVLNFTFDPARRYRVWYTIRALTAGGTRMTLANFGTSFSQDQYFSSDRSYDGATLNWFLTGLSGTYGLQVLSNSGTAGALIYGKDFYVEDLGAA